MIDFEKVQNAKERRAFFDKLLMSGKPFDDEQLIEFMVLMLFRNDGQPKDDASMWTIRQILMKHKNFDLILKEGYLESYSG